jgi:hypothetical protein
MHLIYEQFNCSEAETHGVLNQRKEQFISLNKRASSRQRFIILDKRAISHSQSTTVTFFSFGSSSSSH